MFSIFHFALSASGESFWERMTVWYKSSMLYELLGYLRDRYFTVEFGTYENFSMGAGTANTVQTIIFAVAIGFIIAAFMAVYTRTVLGNFVHALLKSEAKDAESAKDLSSLGFFRSAAIRRELDRGVTLRKVVKCVQEEELRAAKEPTDGEGESEVKATPVGGKTLLEEPRFRPDFTTARYYIPEDLRYRAEIRFEKKGSGWGLMVGTVLISILIAGLICFLLPDIIQLADNLISIMSPKA